MKKHLTLILASSLGLFLMACGDRDPVDGDYCDAKDYRGGRCVNGALHTCENGLLKIKSCGTEGCVVANKVASCKGKEQQSCGNVTELGICENNEVKRCVDGSLVVSKCGNNFTCGSNSQGQAACVLKGQDKPCEGNVTRAGICADEHTLKTCKNGEIETTDCGANQVCKVRSNGVGASCVDKQSDDGCGTIDNKGVCEGRTLKYCQDNKLKIEDCSGLCAVLSGGLAVCAEACEGDKNVGILGLCKGNIAQYCTNAKVNGQAKEVFLSDNCKSKDLVCGYDFREGGYGCIQPDSCNGFPAWTVCADSVTLKSCKNGEIVEQRCGNNGCLAAKGSDGYRYGFCDEPCSGVTKEGKCEDDVVVYCEDNSVLHRWPCASQASGHGKCLTSTSGEATCSK